MSFRARDKLWDRLGDHGRTNRVVYYNLAGDRARFRTSALEASATEMKPPGAFTTVDLEPTRRRDKLLS